MQVIAQWNSRKRAWSVSTIRPRAIMFYLDRVVLYNAYFLPGRGNAKPKFEGTLGTGFEADKVPAKTTITFDTAAHVFAVFNTVAHNAATIILGPGKDILAGQINAVGYTRLGRRRLRQPPIPRITPRRARR